MVPVFLVQESESSSVGSPPISPWDNTLNRVMNALRKKDKLSKPSSAGRVSGKGCSTKWSDYYCSRRKEKGSVKQVEEKLQEKMAEIPRIVEQQVGQALNNMMPSMFGARLACERSTGVAPDAQLHDQYLSQRVGVPGGCSGVSGGPGCGPGYGPG